MVKLRPFLCALGVLSTSALLAQAQTAPTPVAPPPPVPNPSAAAAAATVPAPIDPPIDAAAPAGAAGATAPGAVPPVPGGVEAVPASGGETANPNMRKTAEFQGDEIGLVLRTLARQAGISLVVSDKVQGTVTMRLVEKTPREALETIIDTKGLTMDERNGVFVVKTPEERAKEPTEPRSYTFSYATAKDIAPLLDKQLASAQPSQFDPRTNTIFYREGKSNYEKVQLFLETVDRPTQQVMIEARLVEVTATPQQNYGINWLGVFGGSTPQTISYGGFALPSGASTSTTAATTSTATTSTPSSSTSTFNPTSLLYNGNILKGVGGQLAILSVPQMAITTRLLNEDSDAEFLANPRVVTSNNVKAEIKITRQQPVPQLNFNEQSATAVFSGFQNVEFGNTLVVTPVINKDNFVTLSVKPEISNKVGDETFSFQGASVTSPIIDKRTLDSTVLIKSGDTLAIGGLLQDEVNKTRAKVPVLGDIPVLGYAFQDHSNNRTKRNLLIFITPNIINQGYGTGLEDQVTGLHHSGEEYTDPNGWRNNARGAIRLFPTSDRQVAADYPVPGVAPAPKKTSQPKRKVVVAPDDGTPPAKHKATVTPDDGTPPPK